MVDPMVLGLVLMGLLSVGVGAHMVMTGTMAAFVPVVIVVNMIIASVIALQA